MKISVLTPSIRPEGLKVVQESLEKQTLQDFEWLVELGIPGKGHDLNAAFNRMLKRAKGELIVFLQDYIKIPAKGLENFWDAYQKQPDTFLTAPVGKTLDWETNEWDWRAHPDAKMQWRGWEIDWGAAPLKCLQAIGGFDEELDKYWSSDNVNVAARANLKGYKFDCLIKNPAIAWNHDKVLPHPFRDKFNQEFVSQRISLFENGLEINYLEK